MDNQLMNTSTIETIDSREVAEMIDMKHKDLLKKVRNYEDILTSAKLRPLDFFIPSEYKDGKGETRNCYLLTKKGCEMVANKLTGEKGVIFTAKYVNRFEEMEQKIAEYLKTKKVDAILGRNDRMACIGMRAVKKLGYSIPKDIVIMGFDDTSVCNYVTPSLSSVHLDNEAIAKKAIEMIYLMREGHQIKETVHFKYKIIERESTGK